MTKEKICGIYKIENLINGKVYIGQSIDIYRRWYHHKREAFIGTEKSEKYPIYRAMRKYGLENFSFEIVQECNRDELNDYEMYYIAKYNSYAGKSNSNGYNQTLGGDGGNGRIITEEELKAMSERMVGKYKGSLNPIAKKVVCENIEFGCILDCANHYKISKGAMANWLRENKMPKEWYDKGLHELGKDMSEYSIRDDRPLFGENNHNSMYIETEEDIYYSLADFSEKTGVNSTTVHDWLNGKTTVPKEWDDKHLRYLDGHTDNIMKHFTEDRILEIKKNRSDSHKGHIPANSFKVYCEDKIFDTVTKCADYYGVNANTMINWINCTSYMPKEWYDKGLRREDKDMNDYKIRMQSKRVICEGITFKNVTDCANHYNVSTDMMRRYLNKKNLIPKKFYDMKLHYEGDIFEECGYEIQKEYGHNSKTVVCDDIEYPNVKSCAEYYGINLGTMKEWLNHGNKMPKKFYDLGLHYKDDPMDNYEFSNKTKNVICERKVFESINECAIHYGVKPATMQKWLNGKNNMPQEFKDKGLKYY